MKILQINSVCGIGSTGRIATDLAKVLVENGHECLICYGRGQGKNFDNTYKIGSKFSFYMHALKTRIFDKNGLGSNRYTKKLVEKIKKYNPDLIHLHNIHGYYLNYKILFEFLKGYNKPIVWTLHDCWAFTGHCSHFDYVQCYKWKNCCYNCPQKNEYPKSLVFDRSKKNYINKKKSFTNIKNLTLISPSEWLKNLVKESFLSEYQCEVINNGIDLNVFKPTENNFRQKYNLIDKKIILGVANIWDKWKGFEDFIKLSKIVDDKTKIVLVGLNNKQLKSLPENIIGIQRTDSVYELAQIYSAADVFVNPTYQDNFPTTNLEALACGTPSITYNTGGSVESVFENCGWIVEKGKIEKIAEILKDYHKTEKSINNCILQSKNYDKNNKFKKYVCLYKELANE